MPEAYVIRPATAEDLKGLAALVTTTSFPMEDVTVDVDTKHYGLEMLNNGRGRILTAVLADGTVIGSCFGTMTSYMAEGGPAVLMEDIYVSEDWRGQGIGPTLVDTTVSEVRNDEAGRLHALTSVAIEPPRTVLAQNRTETRL